MLEDDPDREPVNLAGILTDFEFFACFVLPIVLLGAAFAIMKEKDGQLQLKDWGRCLASMFGGVLAAFFVTGAVEYLVLKDGFGIELNIPRHVHWSVWIGMGAVFTAIGERAFHRKIFRSMRGHEAQLKKLKDKEAAKSKLHG